MPGHRQTRPLVLRAAALALGAAGAAVLVETAVRLLPLGLPPGVVAPVSQHDLRFATREHPELGYTLRPGLDACLLATSDFELFRISTRPVPGADPAVGFRERFDDRRQPRTVVIGDSLAMGWGVGDADTIPRVVEQRSGARTWNLGVCGYGPQQALATLERFGLAARPRTVVWIFYPNDFADAVEFDAWTRRGGNPWFVPKTGWHLWLNRHCATYKLYRLLGKARSADRFPWSDGRLRFVFSHHWRTTLDPGNPSTVRGLELTAGCLRRFAELARRGRFRAVLLALPYREQVYREEYASVDPRPAPDGAYRIVLDRAAAAGIEVVDAQPWLREHKAAAPFFTEDPHLTAIGSRLVGERLAAHLAGAENRR